MSESFNHRGFDVHREGNTWKWIYEDYDGAPDSSTRNWFGTSSSREQAIEDIDEIVDDVAMIEKISRNFYKSGVITDPIRILELSKNGGLVYHPIWKMKPAAFIANMQFRNRNRRSN